jgi:energy-converting hydrogenase Eha subunit C
MWAYQFKFWTLWSNGYIMVFLFEFYLQLFYLTKLLASISTIFFIDGRAR